jgi:hypothetical protein
MAKNVAITDFLDTITSGPQFKMTRTKSLESGKCISCATGFSDKNCPTEAARREAKISGICGICFEKIFVEEENIDED